VAFSSSFGSSSPISSTRVISSCPPITRWYHETSTDTSRRSVSAGVTWATKVRLRRLEESCRLAEASGRVYRNRRWCSMLILFRRNLRRWHNRRSWTVKSRKTSLVHHRHHTKVSLFADSSTSLDALDVAVCKEGRAASSCGAPRVMVVKPGYGWILHKPGSACEQKERYKHIWIAHSEERVPL